MQITGEHRHGPDLKGVVGWILFLLALIIIAGLAYRLNHRPVSVRVIEIGKPESQTARPTQAIKHAVPTPPQPQFSNYDSHRICPGAWDTKMDYSKVSDMSHFTVTLEEGCFGGFITMPDAWKKDGWLMSPTDRKAGDWIVFWFAGDHEPRQPLLTTADAELRSKDYTFRVQGRGTVVFYRNGQ